MIKTLLKLYPWKLKQKVKKNMQILVFALFSRFFFSNFNSVDGQPSKSRRTTSLNNFGRRPAASNPMFDADNASRFQDRPSREHDNRREDRDNSRNVRDRIGYRDNRDRSDRDNRSDRNRDRDRDRDRKRSPPRRRSRSRSRERRSKQRRSDSPFSVAHENWKKFKQAERVCYVSNVELDCKFLHSMQN